MGEEKANRETPPSLLTSPSNDDYDYEDSSLVLSQVIPIIKQNVIRSNN